MRTEPSSSPSLFAIEFLEDRTFFAATKIMPLGDSITAAEVGHSSYRYYLWNQLQQHNYTNVDFVGSQTGVNGGSPLNTSFDQNHEGHWGWRADQILASIGGWANTYRPDVVLMHLGTNDMFQGQTVSSTITELGSIIDTVRQYVPNVTFLVAQVIPSTQSATQLQQLDAQIPSLVSQKSTAQSKVLLVDQWTGFNASTETYDGIHPTPAGEQKIANKWYTALTSVLTVSPPAQPPSGTYLADSLTPTFASNGWGPYEKNRANGESNANDGGTITLNGTTYSKGLGVHAASELRYALNGQYSSFQADIGVDDEVGNAGSVVFQVWDNLGNKLYDSGTMTGATATKSINVNVAGKSEIRLIVTDGGNGADSDHGDWAYARLIQSTSSGPVVNTFTGASINEGGTYTVGGSFTDSGAGPWTATVNYGDGSGNQALTLNADKTFNLTHVYADNGNYTVTVTVTSSAGSGNKTAAVTVSNVAPTITMPPNATVNYGNAFTGSGSFTDPGTLDTFTATVNYGDGSGNQALALNANKTFSLSRNYAAGGTFTVTVTITDKDGGTKAGTMTVTVNGGPVQATTYLSDLTPTFTSNAWGPYEKDKSNGENAASDGGPIRIGGVTYTKGLGVHAPSELRYALNKQYSRFLASVGVDGEVGNSGSVRFQVYGDGTLLYDSGTVRGGQAAKSVDVSVANVTELRLVVTDNGDSNYDDHADWADARVTKAQPTGLGVNAFSGATINEGSAYTASGSFSDPSAGPWTATVNYGDGSGVQTLALDQVNKTFALSHAYADNGSYTVTVVVNNGATTAQSTASVVVNNVAPSFSLGSAVSGSPTFSYNGTFTDPGADTWTATVDYGDGSVPQALSLNQTSKSFTLNKVYTYNGTYSVRVTIVDDDGGSSTSTKSVTVTGGQNRPETYLSDLNPTNAANGWGTYERDKSNGENATGDGRTITIAGQTFAKGLGVHAASDITYSLTGGTYTSFDTYYGVDDEEGGAGSVRFQVYLDGVLTWDSGVVRGGQTAGHLILSVAGKSQLRLVVTDAGDGNYSDHADWAGAKLL